MYFKQNIKLNEEKRETFRANYSAVLLFFLISNCQDPSSKGFAGV